MQFWAAFSTGEVNAPFAGAAPSTAAMLSRVLRRRLQPLFRQSFATQQPPPPSSSSAVQPPQFVVDAQRRAEEELRKLTSRTAAVPVGSGNAAVENDDTEVVVRLQAFLVFFHGQDALCDTRHTHVYKLTLTRRIRVRVVAEQPGDGRNRRAKGSGAYSLWRLGTKWAVH